MQEDQGQVARARAIVPTTITGLRPKRSPASAPEGRLHQRPQPGAASLRDTRLKRCRTLAYKGGGDIPRPMLEQGDVDGQEEEYAFTPRVRALQAGYADRGSPGRGSDQPACRTTFSATPAVTAAILAARAWPGHRGFPSPKAELPRRSWRNRPHRGPSLQSWSPSRMPSMARVVGIPGFDHRYAAKRSTSRPGAGTSRSKTSGDRGAAPSCLQASTCPGGQGAMHVLVGFPGTPQFQYRFSRSGRSSLADRTPSKAGSSRISATGVLVHLDGDLVIQVGALRRGLAQVLWPSPQSPPRLPALPWGVRLARLRAAGAVRVARRRADGQRDQGEPIHEGTDGPPTRPALGRDARERKATTPRTAAQGHALPFQLVRSSCTRPPLERTAGPLPISVPARAPGGSCDALPCGSSFPGTPRSWNGWNIERARTRRPIFMPIFQVMPLQTGWPGRWLVRPAR